MVTNGLGSANAKEASASVNFPTSYRCNDAEHRMFAMNWVGDYQSPPPDTRNPGVSGQEKVPRTGQDGDQNVEAGVNGSLCGAKLCLNVKWRWIEPAVHVGDRAQYTLFNFANMEM